MDVFGVLSIENAELKNSLEKAYSDYVKLKNEAIDALILNARLVVALERMVFDFRSYTGVGNCCVCGSKKGFEHHDYCFVGQAIGRSTRPENLVTNLIPGFIKLAKTMIDEAKLK